MKRTTRSAAIAIAAAVLVLPLAAAGCSKDNSNGDKAAFCNLNTEIDAVLDTVKSEDEIAAFTKVLPTMDRGSTRTRRIEPDVQTAITAIRHGLDINDLSELSIQARRGQRAHQAVLQQTAMTVQRLMKTIGLSVVAAADSRSSSGRRTGDARHRLCREELLSPGRNPAQPYSVAGTICRKTSPGDDRTLVIAVHGATYNRLYWDWPQSPASLSLVRRLVPDVSVLSIDLLGSGRSSRPLSARLTQQVQASMLHQLVQIMRTRGFRTVILLGHSSGSGTVTLEAARSRRRWRRRDRFSASLSWPGRSAVAVPGDAGSGIPGRGLDPGYLTTRPGTRATNGFYNAAVADPSVIVYDETHKDVVPAPQAAGFALIINDPSISRAVDVPVLSLVGDHDGFCGSPACPFAYDEPGAWSSAAQLEVHVIANAGHDIHAWRVVRRRRICIVRDWLARHFANPR